MFDVVPELRLAATTTTTKSAPLRNFSPYFKSLPIVKNRQQSPPVLQGPKVGGMGRERAGNRQRHSGEPTQPTRLHLALLPEFDRDGIRRAECKELSRELAAG
jgi:hypothetical protein